MTFSPDIFLVGAASAAIGILGFAIYISNPKSITGRTFFAFSIITILWSIANYFQYNPSGPFVGIWVVRAITFLGCWHALTFFQLCYVFPNDKYRFTKWYFRALVPFVALTSLLTLTPLIFERVLSVSSTGVVTSIQNGPAIPLFGVVVLSLIAAGGMLLVRRTIRSIGIERTQLAYMSAGALITFLCIVIFNIVLPTVFNVAQYISLSAVFLVPIIVLTAYAILRHRLFNVKVAGTATLVFLLAAIVFVEIVFSTELYLVLIRMVILVLVLAVGAMLISSVQREVEQREKIERLSEEKSEFMTFASHEIRNPITAMRGYASLITDGTTGTVSPKSMDAAQKILVLGDEVLALISQFLNKSKLELGQISYDMSDFDVGPVVSVVADGYRPHAEQKGLHMKKDVDTGESLHIKADEAKVKEVIGNIVDNSLKYTQEGAITVSAHRHGVHVRIVVSDTGVGIPAETIPHLFKKFSRADAQKVNILGTGVGLYLAKTFIEAMNGHIWAESEGKGKGSRFIIEFPTATQIRKQ